MNDTMTIDCPSCGKTRSFKSKEGYRKALDGTVCKSCSNSIKMGGTGLLLTCRCGKPKYKSSSTWCRDCHIERSKKYHKEKYRYAKHGITKEWYDERYPSGCSICGDDFGGKAAHVDHCHVGNFVRGLLCPRCNKGLGQFLDSPERLRSAAAYLERNTHGS